MTKKKNGSADHMKFEVLLQNITYLYCSASFYLPKQGCGLKKI